MIAVLKFLIDNWQAILNALIALGAGMIAVFALIPGDQPEKFLRQAVEFLARFSKKPIEEEKPQS